MEEADFAQRLLHYTRNVAITESQRLKIEFARYWSEEMAKPRYADPRRLLRYGFKTYSQNDEDGIIQEIFNRIGTANRSFVEFGVENGFECNTAKLLVEGWRGLWIEVDETSFAAMQSHFSAFVAGGSLKLVREKVTAENINSILASAEMTGEIDILSIDIDNNDYCIWKAIDAIQPRVVVIEYNPSLRPPLSLVVPYDPDRVWDGGNYFGASLGALVALGKAKGYRIVGCCFAGGNAFFVRDDLCGDRFVAPATAEEHYEPERYFTRFMASGHKGRPGYYLAV